MLFPSDILYTRDHEWIRVSGSEALVGITDYAQSELGEIVFLDVPSVGDTVAQAESFGSVEAVKTVSDLFMPASGEVLELNPSLEAHPELVNNDPYGEGWIVRIHLSDAAELASLLDSEAYQATLPKD